MTARAKDEEHLQTLTNHNLSKYIRIKTIHEIDIKQKEDDNRDAKAI